MFFETRRSLIGFRLKINFDPILALEPTFVYVDVTKTPTVNDLIEDIVKRFKLTHEIFIALQNCRLLLSENICILADVNQAKVGIMAAVPSSSSELLKANVPSSFEADLQSPNKNVKNTIQNTPTEKSVKTKKYTCAYDGVALAIKQLQEEQCALNEQVDKSENSTKIEEFHDKIKRRKKKIEEHDEVVHTDDGTSDMEIVFDEMNDLQEKKKRKRKRKHSKKNKDDLSVTGEDEKENVQYNVPTDCARKHIFFDNEEEQPELLDDTHGELGEDTIDVAMKTNTDSFTFQSANIRKRNIEPVMIAMKEQFRKPFSANDKKLQFSNNERKSLSDAESRTMNFPKFDRSRTNSASSQVSLPNLLVKPRVPEKTNPELSTLLMCKQLDTCCQYTVQFSGGKESNVNSMINLSMNGIHNRKSSNSSDRSSKSFSNENNLLEKIPSSGCAEILHSDGNSKADSNLSVVHQMNGTYDANKTKCATYQQTSTQDLDESSDECQVLRQFKIDDNQIRLRNPDGTWQILTPEIAAKELPILDVPKDNQSVVFQMLYINHSMCPTLSNLIYGQVMQYNEDTGKLGLEIPFGFIQDIVQGDEEQAFPDDLIPITGNTYEIHISALRNAKLLT